LPYNKPDKSRGEIECSATYPSDPTVRPPISLWVNDLDHSAGTIFPAEDKHLALAKFPLPQSNEELFSDRFKALIKNNPKKSLNQKLTIQVYDRNLARFEGTIWVTCTITIIGPARL
jgi:hypothetical protein